MYQNSKYPFSPPQWHNVTVPPPTEEILRAKSDLQFNLSDAASDGNWSADDDAEYEGTAATSLDYWNNTTPLWEYEEIPRVRRVDETMQTGFVVYEQAWDI